MEKPETGNFELKSKRIGVLMGGLSKEREISLRTGKAVAQALRSLGYQIVEIDVGRDAPECLVRERVELAFIALHGRYGEDGCIQGMLELMGIPYTGPGVLGSALAMDKDLTKKMAQAAGVRVPAWEVLSKGEDAGSSVPLLPVIIKPNREGSTLGMTIVRNKQDFAPALQEAFRYDKTVLVEQYIEGREVTVGVLDGKPLPVLEIIPKGGFYNFQSKYTKGMTEYRVPADIEAKIEGEVVEASLRVWRTLQLRGVARADFMIDRSGKSWFLEINTIPGMTETSLVPKAAAATGILFPELCERILRSGL